MPSEGDVLSAQGGRVPSQGVMLHLDRGIVPSEGGIQPSDSNMMLSEGGILHSMGSTTSPEGSNAEVGCICTCARERHCFISCKRLGGLGSNLVCGGVCGCEVCGC